MTARPGHTAQSRRRAARSGSSAVEFALVGLPFFFMLFAIMEVGLIFVTDSVLDGAASETARLVRTGQAAGSNMTAAQFKTQLCDEMGIFSGDCPSRASVDVRELTQFRNQTPPDPMANGSSFDSSQLTYVTGQPGSLMLVRVWYKQPLITPFLAQALSRLDDGSTMLISTKAFRNEPYTPASS
jgi:Flp pilus assembly protein TadG